MNLLPVVCFLLIPSPMLATSQVTIVVTTTNRVSVTVTGVFTLPTYCAKLVGVTGTCRRRRGFQFERPEILKFDGFDGFDELYGGEPGMYPSSPIE